MGNELSIALRIQAFVDQAKAAVRDFTKDVDTLGQTGTDTGAALNDVGSDQNTVGLNNAAAGARNTSQELLKLQNAAMTASRTMTQAGDAGVAASARYVQMLQRQLDVLGMNRAELEAYRAKALGLSAAEQQQAAAIGGKIDAWQRDEAAAKLAAKAEDAAMVGVAGHGGAASTAMRDLGLNTSTAVREVVVLGREIASGNFSRIPGSLSILAGQTNLATLAFRLLFNPITLVVGAVSALAIAYIQGTRETEHFNIATQATGNFAGETAGKIDALASNAAKVSGISQSNARAVAMEMVSSGQLGSATIDNLVKSVETYAAVTGQTEKQAGAALTRMFEDPKHAADELNQSMHFLTAEDLNYIDTLVKHGQTDAAQLELSKKLFAYLGTTAVDNLSDLEKWWHRVEDAASSAWEKMKRAASGNLTPDDKLERARSQLANFDAIAQTDNSPDHVASGRTAAARADIEALITTLEKEKAADEAAAAAKHAGTVALVERNQVSKDYNKIVEGNLTSAQKMNAELATIDEALLKNLITQDQHDKQVDLTRARYQQRGNGAFSAGKGTSETNIAALKANFDAMKKAITAGDAAVDQAYKDGQITLDATYADRLNSLQTEARAERETIEAQLGNVDGALAKATTAQQRAPLQKQKIELTAKLDLVQASLDEGTRKLGVWKTAQEKSLATITAKIKIDVAGLTGQFDRSAFQQQLQLQYASDYQRAGNISDPTDQAAQRQRLDLIVQSGVAQGEMNAKLQEAQRIQQQLAVQEGEINNEAQAGQISQIEAEARIKAAREAQLPTLNEIVQQLGKMRDAIPAEAAASIDQATTSIGQLQNQVQAATPVIVDFGTQAKNTAIDGLANAAATAVTNFSNLRQSIASTLQQIAGDIVRSSIKRLLVDQFTPTTGNSGGSSGSALGSIGGALMQYFGFAGGGSLRAVKHFSSGGKISGPGTGTSDSVPAIVDGRTPIAVSNEEYIQPEKAVKHYGVGFMEAVRTLRFPKPRFAFGGLVQAHQAARFATGGAANAGSGAAGMSGMPSLSIQFVNQGTPQRMVSQQQTMNGKDMIVSVVLSDLSSGGPISKGINGAVARGR